jgi:hypothetical protein
MVLRTVFTKELLYFLKKTGQWFDEHITCRVNRAKVSQQQEFCGLFFNVVEIGSGRALKEYNKRS